VSKGRDPQARGHVRLNFNKRFGLRHAIGIAVVLGVIATQVLFPGRRTLLAFTIGTGLGRDSLQRQIDTLEDKAIEGVALSDEDLSFLEDFYSTLASGARASFVARQTGGMMQHYLDSSGTPYQLDPSIFVGNAKVQVQAERMLKKARKLRCDGQTTLSSPRFYMPDRSNTDSVFGLYYGRLQVTPIRQSDGACEFLWRAEVPWAWPSYEDLRTKYGNPHAESFPLPNARSLLQGKQYALYVDNGLGHHLERIGLAKSFLAYAEWSSGHWAPSE
jgi:hypothetical protein